MTVASIREPASTLLTLADGRVLHALVWPGTGMPLVLLHGILDSADGWSDLCRATSRPCVAFDVGGFGCSDLPAQPSMAAYAEDIIEGMALLGLDEVVLVGHSLGGGVAAAVAERLPDRVQSLVLLAPAGFGRVAVAEVVSLPGIRHAIERLLPIALRNRMALAAAYRAMVTNGVEPTQEIIDRVAEQHHALLVTAAREATKAVVRASLSPHAFHRRRLRYSGPVVAVWGDRDRIVPHGHLAGVATAFPQVQGHVWPGMGHHHKQERPAALAELMERTCRALTGERPARVTGAAALAARPEFA